MKEFPVQKARGTLLSPSNVFDAFGGPGQSIGFKGIDCTLVSTCNGRLADRLFKFHISSQPHPDGLARFSHGTGLSESSSSASSSAGFAHQRQMSGGKTCVNGWFDRNGMQHCGNFPRMQKTVLKQLLISPSLLPVPGSYQQHLACFPQKDPYFRQRQRFVT